MYTSWVIKKEDGGYRHVFKYKRGTKSYLSGNMWWWYGALMVFPSNLIKWATEFLSLTQSHKTDL